MRTIHRSLLASAFVAVAALSFSGCAVTGAVVESAAAEAPASPVADAAASVTLTDGWAKAAESGMTAVFGSLENAGAEDVVVVSAATDAADAIELHEVVADGSGTMTMREKEGGFPIPAGDHAHLEPGGDHIMLMGLTGPLLPGDELDLTITFDDGSSLDLTVPVKDYEGANESYDGGEHGAH
ncbi:copper chaperone PCu(A)C [Agromyces sp. H66]|uniref:copper chaperone PCu(A)C n=1 Tax=Agromyces sp. H66 TaxID=2529859 RepID=UPI0010A9EBAF|nr:copper chaperone PCu(A)C [Agromyces sp. H66]